MIQFTAIKMFREGKWESMLKGHDGSGTLILVNPKEISSISDEPLASGDPACIIAMTNGDQIVADEAVHAAIEALVEYELS